MLHAKLSSLLLFTFLLLQGCDAAHEVTQNDEANLNSNKQLVETNEKHKDISTIEDISSNNVRNIDVLVVINQKDAGSSSIKTKIAHYISTANQVFKNSTVPVKLNIVDIHPYAFQKKTSADVLYEMRASEDIENRRKNVQADIVLAYEKYAHDGLCGIALTNSILNSNIAHAHITLDCPSTTTAHEVGHIMGLEHSIKKSIDKGRFSYGKGYGVDGEFSTIMSYKSTYRTSVRVHNYSSPKLDCMGYECGLEDQADSVKALKKSLRKIVSFR